LAFYIFTVQFIAILKCYNQFDIEPRLSQVLQGWNSSHLLQASKELRGWKHKANDIY